MSVYVSITGLKLRAVWHLPAFWRLSTAAMAQAQSAPGCLTANARSIDGYHHTLSVWESEADMNRYLVSGAHLRAMQSFSKIATGKTYGATMDAAPDWATAHDLWLRLGKDPTERPSPTAPDH